MIEYRPVDFIQSFYHSVIQLLFNNIQQLNVEHQC